MANHITDLRKRAGFKTATEAAEKLNISPSMMYQMEGGYKRPSPDLGVKMAEIFNCTLEEIFLPFVTTQPQAQKKTDKEKRRMRIIDIIHELVCIQAILYSPGHTTLKLATTINRINELIRKLLDSNCIYCPIDCIYFPVEEKLDKLIKSIEKTPFKDCYIEELAKTAKGGTD